MVLGPVVQGLFGSVLQKLSTIREHGTYTVYIVHTFECIAKKSMQVPGHTEENVVT